MSTDDRLSPDTAQIEAILRDSWEHVDNLEDFYRTASIRLHEPMSRPAQSPGGPIAKVVARLRQYISVFDGDGYADDNEPNFREDVETACTAALASPSGNAPEHVAWRFKNPSATRWQHCSAEYTPPEGTIFEPLYVGSFASTECRAQTSRDRE